MGGQALADMLKGYGQRNDVLVVRRYTQVQHAVPHTCEETEMNSPTAMLRAPATSPATPESTIAYVT